MLWLAILFAFVVLVCVLLFVLLRSWRTRAIKAEQTVEQIRTLRDNLQKITETAQEAIHEVRTDAAQAQLPPGASGVDVADALLGRFGVRNDLADRTITTTPEVRAPDTAATDDGADPARPELGSGRVCGG